MTVAQPAAPGGTPTTAATCLAFQPPKIRLYGTPREGKAASDIADITADIARNGCEARTAAMLCVDYALPPEKALPARTLIEHSPRGRAFPAGQRVGSLWVHGHGQARNAIRYKILQCTADDDACHAAMLDIDVCSKFGEWSYFAHLPEPVAPESPVVRADRFLGCYRENRAIHYEGTPGRVLAGACFTSDLARRGKGNCAASEPMTVERCSAACRSRGFSHAGVQYGDWCFCGNGVAGTEPSTNCNMRCPGNPAQTCGGAFANSVYELAPGR